MGDTGCAFRTAAVGIAGIGATARYPDGRAGWRRQDQVHHAALDHLLGDQPRELRVHMPCPWATVRMASSMYRGFDRLASSAGARWDQSAAVAPHGRKNLVDSCRTPTDSHCPTSVPVNGRLMSPVGPRLTTWALQQVGSYLGYTGRHLAAASGSRGPTAADSPSPSPDVGRLGNAARQPVKTSVQRGTTRPCSPPRRTAAAPAPRR
jgi:hypothetical protein